MDDIRAVMDAVGSERSALFSFEEGFALCALFAATYPERVAALMSFAAVAVSRAKPEFPGGTADPDWDEYLENVERGWGTVAFAQEEGQDVWPDVDDPAWWRDYATWMRGSVSPGDAHALLREDSRTADRALLLSIPILPSWFTGRTMSRSRSSSREPSRFLSRGEAGGTARGGTTGGWHPTRTRCSTPSKGSSGSFARRKTNSIPRPCHRPVHAHRQLHREGSRARGSRIGSAPRATPCHGPRDPLALPGQGDRHRRRRFLRNIRRSGSSRAVRSGDHRRRDASRARDQGRGSHGGDRGEDRRRWRRSRCTSDLESGLLPAPTRCSSPPP